jgi:hypothetical protein
MARIAGLKLIKNTSGKVTHATLSMKHHAKLIEDIIDHKLIVAGRKDEFIPWEVAKKGLLAAAEKKSKKK